jgi:putative NADH-flavin reductase
MKILMAGLTGYWASHTVQELMARQMDFKAIVRNTHKLVQLGLSHSQMIEAQVTDQSSLTQSGEGIDTVISAVGITC